MRRTDPRRAFAERQRQAMLATMKPQNFRELDLIAARRRVHELAALGISDDTIAEMTGWGKIDVCRALAERMQ